MVAVTIRNLSEEAHRALKVRAAQHSLRGAGRVSSGSGCQRGATPSGRVTFDTP